MEFSSGTRRRFLRHTSVVCGAFALPAFAVMVQQTSTPEGVEPPDEAPQGQGEG